MGKPRIAVKYGWLCRELIARARSEAANGLLDTCSERCVVISTQPQRRAEGDPDATRPDEQRADRH